VARVSGLERMRGYVGCVCWATTVEGVVAARSICLYFNLIAQGRETCGNGTKVMGLFRLCVGGLVWAMSSSHALVRALQHKGTCGC
jgi:hypothetical protein